MSDHNTLIGSDTTSDKIDLHENRLILLSNRRSISLGFWTIFVSICLSITSIYDLVFIALNIKNMECVRQPIHIMLIVIGSFELIVSLILLGNTLRIRRFCNAMNQKNLINIDYDPDFEQVERMFKCILICHMFVILAEFVPSLLLWDIFYPPHCTEFWFNNAFNAIFYIIHIIFGWSWILILFIGFILCLFMVCVNNI